MRARDAEVPAGAWPAKLLAALLFVGSVVLVQRDFLFSGLEVVTGDTEDGLIAYAIILHWSNVLDGAAPWHSVGWFHPLGRTLGYNDGYLLFGVAAWVFRQAGLDPFLAVEFTVMVFAGIGFLAGLALARRLLGLGIAWAAAAAAISTLSPGLLLGTASHIQLYAVGPGLLWCLLTAQAAQAFLAGRRAAFLLTGCLAALLAGALMLTAFYVFWVIGLAMVLAGLVFVAFMPGAERRALFGVPRPWALLPLPILVLAAALLPALWLYLPVAQQTGTHGAAAMRVFALGPLSVLDVGRTNAAWGWLAPWLERDAAGVSLRDRFSPRGVPPLTAALVLLAMPLLWRGRADPRRRFALAFLIACVLLVLASVDFGGRAWLWPRSFVHVPGAGAVRELSRVLVILAPVAMLAAVVPLAAAWRAGWRVAPPGLMLLLLAEQWTPVPDAGLRRGPELARLARLADVPPGCEVFVATVPRVLRARHETDELYSHNVDAMLLASFTARRTINGFSSFNPPGWDLAAPNSPSYERRLRGQLAASGVAGPVCGVDFARLRWAGPGEPWVFETALPAMPTAAIGAPLPIGGRRDAAGWLDAGFHTPEPWGVWARAEARLVLPLPEGWRGAGEVRLTLQRFAAGPGQVPVILAIAGEAEVAVEIADAAPREIGLRFGAATAAAGPLHLTLRDSRAVSPAVLGVSSDGRVLGVGLLAIAFHRE